MTWNVLVFAFKLFHPGVSELSICRLAFLLQSKAEYVVTNSGYMEVVKWMEVKISGRIYDLFWVHFMPNTNGSK